MRVFAVFAVFATTLVLAACGELPTTDTSIGLSRAAMCAEPPCGIPDPAPDPTPAPTPTVMTLGNGQVVSGLSGGAGSDAYFRIDVPAGADKVAFELTGSTGDANLYVLQGELPTTKRYQCRPYLDGSNELCVLPGSPVGQLIYFVSVHGYTDYSGVSLRAVYSQKLEMNAAPLPYHSGAGGSDLFYTVDAPAEFPARIAIFGGTGDADLYVRFGALPSLSSYDCRPYLDGNSEECQVPGRAGTYWVMVHGYGAFSSVSLGAQQVTRVRIVQFNTDTGNDMEVNGMPKPVGYVEICNEIMSLNPDIVVFNEVHDNMPSGRAPNFSQPPYWRQLLYPGANCAATGQYINGYYRPGLVGYDLWGNTIGRTGGNLVLSKWPFATGSVVQDQGLSTRTIPMAGFLLHAKVFENSKGSVDVMVNGLRIRVASMHLSTLDPNKTTAQHLSDYLDWLQLATPYTDSETPTVLAGDSNLSTSSLYDPNDPNYAAPAFVKARADWSTIPATFDSDVDWIMVRKQGRAQVINGGTTWDNEYSYHHVAWADVLVTPQYRLGP